MRELIVGALALVLGVVLGGILPRGEVRRLEGEIAELQERECATGVGSDLAGLFLRPPVPAPDEPSGEPPPDVAPPEPAGGLEIGGVEVADGEGTEPAGEDLETAKMALTLRTTQARASLVEDAGPDEEQMDAFDAAVEDMNADLHDLAAEMVGRFADGGEPTRREAMVFAADALDVLIAAEDRMTEALDEDQRASVEPEALDPFSYIDPALLDLLSELDQ